MTPPRVTVSTGGRDRLGRDGRGTARGMGEVITREYECFVAAHSKTSVFACYRVANVKTSEFTCNNVSPQYATRNRVVLDYPSKRMCGCACHNGARSRGIPLVAPMDGQSQMSPRTS